MPRTKPLTASLLQTLLALTGAGICLFITVACDPAINEIKPTSPPWEWGDDSVHLNTGVPLKYVNHIALDPAFDSTTQEMIATDLEILQNLEFNSESPLGQALASRMEIPNLQGPTLLAWLEARVQLFLHSNTWHFQPNPAPFAENLTFVIYPHELAEFGNQTKLLLRPADGHSRVTGVVRLYPALLNERHPHHPAWKLTWSLRRLSTYLHEARHTDGNKLHGTFNFPHSPCHQSPQELRSPSCESFDNGATAIQYYFIRNVLENCLNCEEVDRFRLLRELFAIQQRYQYQPNLPWGNATPEFHP